MNRLLGAEGRGVADDRQQPPDATGSAGRRPDPGEELDRTREFDPIAEEEDGPAHPDRTSDETAPQPGIDETAALPGGRVVWTGRAAVPRPNPSAPSDATEWGEAEERTGRHWWMPILLAVVALSLLGVLTYGVWLGLRSGQQMPGPLPPAPSTPASAPPTPTFRSPSVEPTATQPTPSGTSAAATVEMPALIGQPEAIARAALDRLGLAYRVELRSSGRTPGTVIETQPDAGTPVPPGTRVILVIARAPATPSAAASPTAYTPTPSPR